MKRIVVLSVVLIFVIFASAQQDEKAKGILDKVSEKTRSFNSMSAAFSFSMQNKESDVDEKYEGSIKLKGQKYCVAIPEFGANVYSDGTTIWNYMKEGNQVTINNIDDGASELMDPSSLFSIYEKGFSSKFIAEKNVGGKMVYEIELFPDNDSYDVSKITVFINKSSMLLQSAVLLDASGTEFVILVKKMETNHDYPDSDFVFDSSKYPDIEEIDWR